MDWMSWKVHAIRAGSMLSVVLALGALGPSGPVAAAALATPGSGCFRVPLEASPAWVNSLAWDAEERRVLMADPLSNTLKIYDEAGHLVRRLHNPVLRPSGTSLELTNLDSVADGSFLLKLRGTEFVEFDLEDGGIVASRSFELRSSTEPGTSGLVRAIYLWEEGAGSLVAYGSVADPESDRGFQMGFFTVPLDKDGVVSSFLPFDHEKYYSIGLDYLAVVGQHAYVLAMEKSPEIWRLPLSGAGEVEKLAVFPADFSPRPDLETEVTGPASVRPVFSEIEHLRFPVGMYSQGDHLYLLVREPTGSGNASSSWSVFKIFVGASEGREAEVVGRFRVPVSPATKHVDMLWTDEQIFVLEKGPVVDELGRQPTPSMLRLPVAWFGEEATSPLAFHSTETVHCKNAGQ